MTAHNVIQSFIASQQTMSRLAYRTAIYQRMSPKHLPKSEEAIFAKAKKPQRQNLKDQFAMAKLVTQMMSTKVH